MTTCYMNLDDSRKRYEFSVDTLDGNYLNRIFLGDEATFHVSAHVHFHNESDRLFSVH